MSRKRDQRSQGQGGGDAISTAITVEQQLREATREAREMLKDMEVERKRMTAERERIEELYANLPKITEETIGDKIRDEVGKLEAVTKDAMDKAVARVNAKFDELADILTGRSRAQRRTGTPTLEEVIAAALQLPPGVPMDITMERIVPPTENH